MVENDSSHNALARTLMRQFVAAANENDRLRARVDELLRANTREVERRQQAEQRLAEALEAACRNSI